MTEVSYATKRKQRIIAEKLGENWQEQHPGRSIDAVYNIVTGDSRKNLFCKVEPDIKTMVDEMVDYHDIKMSELVEKLVREEYTRYLARREAHVEGVATQFMTTA